MKYKFAQNRNFEDYASGRFFYTRPGQPAFPVRLASEIFQRALEHVQSTGGRDKLCTVYDPVCGGAYWLAVLAYLHWEMIAAIYASDLDTDILLTAERNLSLITPKGLDRRIVEIEAMLTAYQKESHADALMSAKKFDQQLQTNLGSHTIIKRVFQADATNSESMAGWLGERSVDLVLADVPYGWHSEWRMGKAELAAMDPGGQAPIELMLNAVYDILKQGAVVAIATEKNQKVKHQKYRRLERFQVGKRRIIILQAK